MDAIHIIGAGGIGCAVGYALRSVDVPVIVVETNPQKIEHGKRHGVEVAGRPAITAEFVSFNDWSPPNNGIILLCTKCYDNAAVLKKLEHFRVLRSGTRKSSERPPRRNSCEFRYSETENALTPNTRLLPIQNGFDPQLDDMNHETEGISSFVSECEADRPVTRITRKGDLHLGGRGGSSPSWLAQLAEPLRRAGLFRVIEVEDVRPIKYTKLMYNAAISPLAAAAGIDNGDLLRVPLARRLFFELLQENYAILRHANKPLGKVGPFHPDTVMKILRRRWLSRGLAFAFYPGLRGTYCSMSGDISKGRTEIANYNERLVEWAGDFSCPLNRRVVALVKQMEQDRAIPNANFLNKLDSVV